MLKILRRAQAPQSDLQTALRGKKFLDALMERERRIAEQKREIVRLRQRLAAHEQRRDKAGCFW